MLFALINGQPIQAGKGALTGMKFVPTCVYCGMQVYLDEQLAAFAWKHQNYGDGVACQLERDEAQTELDKVLNVNR